MAKTVPTVPLSGASDPAAADAAGSAADGAASAGSVGAPGRTQPLRARERTLSGAEAEAARASVADDDEADDRAGETADRVVDPDRADELIGRILAGRYEIRAVLGRGGMGLVYSGWHLAVDRPVAIKVLRRDLARSTDAVARFHREARAAAKIGSEHIIDVIDYNYTDEGDAYIVMELLEGEDLGKVIRREGPLAEGRAATIARQVGRALEMAHAKGIIHRDLKSENVFVLQREGRDYVKLLDFGISKVSEGDEGRGPMTSEGVVMGTPHYMAPEQAISAAETDHRIDLYALGCLLYEMLTGRVPFTGKNAVEVVFKHVHEAPVPPSQVRAGGVTPELEAVVLKLLAKAREARFASAGEFLTALDAARASMPGAEGLAPGTTGPQRAEALAATGAGERPAATATPGTAPRAWRSWAVAGVAVAGLAAVLATRPAATPGQVVGSDPRANITADAGVQALTRATPEAGARAIEPVPAAATDAATSAPDAGAPGAVVPRDTWWTIEVQPRTARIEIDGEEEYAGPRARARVAHGVEHRLVLTAPGYVPQSHTVTVAHAMTSRFVLARAPGGVVASRGDASAASAVAADASSGGGIHREADAGASEPDGPHGTPTGGGGGEDPGGAPDAGDLDPLHGNPYGAGQASTPR